MEKTRPSPNIIKILIQIRCQISKPTFHSKIGIRNAGSHEELFHDLREGRRSRIIAGGRMCEKSFCDDRGLRVE
jgi:hypothetical protein